MKRFWAFCKTFVNSDLGGCLTAFFLLPLSLYLAAWALDQLGLGQAFLDLLKALWEFGAEVVAPNFLWFLLAWGAFVAIRVYLDQRR